MMGTIYRRGNVLWLKYFKDGKPYYESTRGDSEAKAKKLLKLREGEISLGREPGVVYDRTRFEDLEEMFLDDRRTNIKRSVASVAEAEKRLKHLRPFFGNARVSTIKSDRIAAYRSQRLAEGAAPASVNRELAALRRMLTLGYRAEKVAKVPYIQMLEEDNVRTGFLEDFEFDALREALPAYMKGVLSFGYLTGCRKEEVLGLTWDRVNIQERTVTLRPNQTKNREARNLYMEEDLISVMVDQWAEQSGPYVFHRGGGKIQDIRGVWNTACREAGIGYGYKLNTKYAQEWEAKGLSEGPLYHDLRRSAIRQMDRAGIPRQIAMMRSGHKTESTFNRYNIGTDADLKNAAQKLETYRHGGEVKTDTSEQQLTPEQRLLMWSFLLMSKAENVTKPLQAAKISDRKRI
jgi:integrase